MPGEYTEITVTAPYSAPVGSVVDVLVEIKNLLDYTIFVTPILDINGSITEGSYETVTPGETHSWSFTFTMPSTSAVLTVSSWCESYMFDWQLDYSVSHTVLVTGAGVGIDITALMGMMMVIAIMGIIMKEV